MKERITDHLHNKFNNIESMCNHWEKPVDIYLARIEAGWTMEDALTFPVRQNDYDVVDQTKELDTIKGVFDTLKGLAEKCNISYITLHKRLNKLMWDIDVAVVTPVKDDVAARGIGRKTKCCYYRVPWSTKLVTARQVIEHYEPNKLTEYDRLNPDGRYRPYKI